MIETVHGWSPAGLIVIWSHQLMQIVSGMSIRDLLRSHRQDLLVQFCAPSMPAQQKVRQVSNPNNNNNNNVSFANHKVLQVPCLYLILELSKASHLVLGFIFLTLFALLGKGRDNQPCWRAHACWEGFDNAKQHDISTHLDARCHPCSQCGCLLFGYGFKLPMFLSSKRFDLACGQRGIKGCRTIKQYPPSQRDINKRRS